MRSVRAEAAVFLGASGGRNFLTIFRFGANIRAFPIHDMQPDKQSMERLCAAAESRNIKLIPAEKNGAVSLCLSGIPEADIAPALAELRKIFQEDS